MSQVTKISFECTCRLLSTQTYVYSYVMAVSGVLLILILIMSFQQYRPNVSKKSLTVDSNGQRCFGAIKKKRLQITRKRVRSWYRTVKGGVQGTLQVLQARPYPDGWDGSTEAVYRSGSPVNKKPRYTYPEPVDRSTENIGIRTRSR